MSTPGQTILGHFLLGEFDQEFFPKSKNVIRTRQKPNNLDPENHQSPKIQKALSWVSFPMFANDYLEDRSARTGQLAASACSQARIFPGWWLARDDQQLGSGSIRLSVRFGRLHVPPSFVKPRCCRMRIFFYSHSPVMFCNPEVIGRSRPQNSYHEHIFIGLTAFRVDDSCMTPPMLVDITCLSLFCDASRSFYLEMSASRALSSVATSKFQSWDGSYRYKYTPPHWHRTQRNVHIH